VGLTPALPEQVGLGQFADARPMLREAMAMRAERKKVVVFIVGVLSDFEASAIACEERKRERERERAREMGRTRYR
jgi:hypothetical protein